MSQVLEEHQLSCTDLLLVNTDGIVITKQSKILVNFKTVSLVILYCML